MPSTLAEDAVVAVYLTFPDAEVAERVGAELVTRRLVACVNIMPPGRSIYRWEGEVVSESEVVAVAKTVRRQVVDVVAALQELHPYELPCAVAYPAIDGSQAYLDWVRDEVRRVDTDAS